VDVGKRNFCGEFSINQILIFTLLSFQMSFFSKPQAQIRQEGFHLSTPSTTPPPPPPFDIFLKFPSATHTMDFGDELANLIHPSSPDNQESYDDNYRPHLFDSQNFRYSS
jgi:hypothetical protein